MKLNNLPTNLSQAAMWLLALCMCVSMASCSDDKDEPSGSALPAPALSQHAAVLDFDNNDFAWGQFIFFEHGEALVTFDEKHAIEPQLYTYTMQGDTYRVKAGSIVLLMTIKNENSGKCTVDITTEGGDVTAPVTAKITRPGKLDAVDVTLCRKWKVARLTITEGMDGLEDKASGSSVNELYQSMVAVVEKNNGPMSESDKKEMKESVEDYFSTVIGVSGTHYAYFYSKVYDSDGMIAPFTWSRSGKSMVPHLTLPDEGIGTTTTLSNVELNGTQASFSITIDFNYNSGGEKHTGFMKMEYVFSPA